MFKKYLSETLKYLLGLAIIITLVILNWNMWSKNSGQVETVKKLKKQLSVQIQENADMKDVNAGLHRRINSLKLGSIEMIEEEARDNFGMVGEGETFIEFKSENE